MNSSGHAGGPPHFRQFPKIRPPLPEAYLALYDREYLANRTGGGVANRLARKAESWMHIKVRETARKRSEEILELGAGSLNHLAWERDFSAYDIVEPFRKLFEASGHLRRIRHVYDQLSAIPPERQYDRILSVAVLEHMVDLPREIALACMRLRDGGVFCAGVPSEGGRLWELAWRYGTGTAFRRRTGLDYAVMMHHEHVNTADEIESCIRYFFRDVSIARFPLPALSLSLYTFLSATGADKERCARFLESRR
jgi:SAM-dependent methyltransferase